MRRFKPFRLHQAGHEGPLGRPVAQLAQTLACAILPVAFWLHVKNAQKGMLFCDSARSLQIAASHRQTQSGVPSPSAPEGAMEGAPGGDLAKPVIAERHVRLSIRVLEVSDHPCAGLPSIATRVSD